MFSAVSLLPQLIVRGPAHSSAFSIFAALNSRKSSRICTSSALDLLLLPPGGRNESRIQGTGQPRQYYEIMSAAEAD